MGRMQPQDALLTGAAAREIENSAEMSVGVMVPSNRLIPIADHRPATLKMQSHMASGETNQLEIVPCLIHHLMGQGLEGLLLMQLPHPMEVTRPGAPLAGVAPGLAAKLQQSLHARRLLQRFQKKFSGRHYGGKELMKLKHSETLKALHITVKEA